MAQSRPDSYYESWLSGTVRRNRGTRNIGNMLITTVVPGESYRVIFHLPDRAPSLVIARDSIERDPAGAARTLKEFMEQRLPTGSMEDVEPEQIADLAKEILCELRKTGNPRAWHDTKTADRIYFTIAQGPREFKAPWTIEWGSMATSRDAERSRALSESSSSNSSRSSFRLPLPGAY